ncbi:hypothetical protein KIL84_004293, partial [Mauremys mutica]
MGKAESRDTVVPTDLKWDLTSVILGPRQNTKKIQTHLKTLRKEREKLLRLNVVGKKRIQEYLDVRSTLSRCEKGTFQQPVEMCPELEKSLSDFAQKTIALMKTLRKVKDILPIELEGKKENTPGSHRQ